MQPNVELLLHVNNYSITGVITAFKHTLNYLSLLKKTKPKWIKFQKQKIYFTQKKKIKGNKKYF